ncbi:MAG: response regulator [Spirochaetales bacterium]|nr:response regulator [Spirochaetales bacterium]
MPSGGRLLIETSNTVLDIGEKDGDAGIQKPYIEMTVSDTGQGMDETILANLFEPFYTTKDPEHGTGLGLSTVYGIIQQHGGKINVYSEPGHGSSFKIYFPRIYQDAEELLPELEIPVTGGSESILVAEDDPSVLKLVTKILRTAGYAVTGAVDGLEAFEKYSKSKNQFDLIILDIIMPKMSGIEVIEKIRKTRPDMKFIFSSGYSPTILDIDFFKKNNCIFVHKPYQSRKLLRTLRETLEQE